MKFQVANFAKLAIICCLAVPLWAAAGDSPEEIKLEWQSSAISSLVRGYVPLSIELDEVRPAGIKKIPNDLVSPRYGKLKLGPKESQGKYSVVLDAPNGVPSRLFVDANKNGDLTDDPPTEWKAERILQSDGKAFKDTGGVERYRGMGRATVEVPYGAEKLTLSIVFYYQPLLDADRLCYFRDYGRVGKIQFGEKVYDALLCDQAVVGDFREIGSAVSPGTRLLIDLNKDGQFDRRESFSIAEPFNIGGATYEIADMSASGSSFKIVKSAAEVPETKPMNSISVGEKAPPFAAVTVAGKSVSFPNQYAGKLVLLDFWATWCSPCVAEMPNLVAVYDQFHSQGLEVLGISSDRPDSDDVATFTAEHKIPWPQIYSEQSSQRKIGDLYCVDSIPCAFLIDGDSGQIVAVGRDVRGEQLRKTIEAALAKKHSHN